jgi:predicted dehydrogenase
MSVRVGFLGTGLIALAHAAALLSMRDAGVVDVEVASCYDADLGRAEGFAALTGARVAPGPEAALDGVDACYVCTPTGAHPSGVATAADAGVAVFCEKPIARSLAEAEATAAAVDEAGVVNQVGLVLRRSPVLRLLGGLLSAGRLGRPMAAVLRDDQYFPIQGHYASSWRADAEAAGGGTLLEHSIHDLDLLAVLLGPVDEVAATTASFAGYAGVEDVALATLRFSSGCAASLVSAWHQILTRPSTRRLEVIGEDAVAWLDDERTGPLHLQDGNGVTVLPAPFPDWVAALPLADDEAGLAVRSYAEADRAFVEAVAEAAPASPALAEGIAAHRLVDAAYRSASSGGLPVRLGTP